MLNFLFEFINAFSSGGLILPAPLLAFVQLGLWFLIGSVLLFVFRLILSLIKGW